MGFQNSWTESHKNEVEGLTITESWIKESMTMDKSILLGLDANLPIGTWFIGCYCENDEIWNAVKSGTYAGFSIEALLSVEEFESQINNDDKIMIEMTNEEMNLFQKFKMWLESFSELSEEEKNAMENFNETIEAQMEGQEPTTEPTVEPTVEPQTEPKVEPQAEPTVEPAVEEPKVEEPKVEPTVEPQNEPTEPKTEDNSHLEELINNLKAEIEALKSSNEGLTEKIKEMGKQPSAQPISINAKNGGNGGDNYAAWREQLRNLIG